MTGGTLYWVHQDHIGRPVMVAGQDGDRQWQAGYRPFGQIFGGAGRVPINLRFPGQYFDAETGLHHNYFRDYDPTTGRYIQSDPIGLGGGWNTYGYVGGNPVMRVDPRGLVVAGVIPTPPSSGNSKPCGTDYDCFAKYGGLLLLCSVEVKRCVEGCVETFWSTWPPFSCVDECEETGNKCSKPYTDCLHPYDDDYH